MCLTLFNYSLLISLIDLTYLFYKLMITTLHIGTKKCRTEEIVEDNQ